MTAMLERPPTTRSDHRRARSPSRPAQTITKIVGGKTVTMTPEQADAFGRELDAIRERVIADLGERDATYIRRVIKAQRGLEVGGRALLFAGIFPPAWLAGTAMLGRVEDPRQHGDRPQRHARPVRLDGRSRADGPQLRVGHRLPQRPVAALAQLHAPHLHQHRRHGPRHRLRHPAHERGPEVGPVLPRQPGLRVPADGAVPVRRRAARTRDRAHPLRRDLDRRQARDPRGHLEEGEAPDAEGLRRLPAAGRPVRAVGVRRQHDRQPDAQRVVVRDHLLRPLPRRHPGVHHRGDRRTRPAACGTSARCSARRT